MNLTPPLPRFAQDDRVVVVPRLADFDVLRAGDPSVRGVIMPYAPPEAVRESVLAYARARLTEVQHDCFSEEVRADRADLVALAAPLCDAFHRASGHAPQSVRLTVNNMRPHGVHRHEATLTYTLSGPGTLVERVRDVFYPVPDEHLFMMADGLPHTAPKFTPRTDAPRVMVMVY